jgi:DNA replication protein DnaC
VQTGECPVCGGYGYFKVDVPMTDPRWGKAQPCPRCELPRLRRERAEHLREVSGVPQDLSRYTFDTFQADSAKGTAAERREMGEIVEAVREYADEPKGWLVLHGHYGCGKTHLAYAIVNRCRELGRSVYYGSLPELLDTLKQGFNDSARMDYDTRLKTMLEVELLVLDDLGAQAVTPWSEEKVFELTNYRYTRRLPLVVTTNLNVRDRQCPLEPRVLSRLNDVRLCRVLALPAGDYRRAA